MTLCKLHLNKDEQKIFIDAIKKEYIFEMFIGKEKKNLILMSEKNQILSKQDDLPVHGLVGLLQQDSDEKEHYLLFQHLHFHILYNNDQVIYVNTSQDTSKVSNPPIENLGLSF